MPRLILLGDSIFDNAAYVAGGPAVVQQLQAGLPVGWEAILRAVDGAVTTDVPRQLQGLPQQSTLIVSVGGNDALGWSDILDQEVHAPAEALTMLADMRDQFAADYQAMLVSDCVEMHQNGQDENGAFFWHQICYGSRL